MGQIGAVDDQLGVGVRPIVGDAEADVLVRILFLRLELGQQLFGLGQLFLPLRRRRDNEPADPSALATH
jgi:hypothetical protein